ncbi:MAG: hypothetical protein A2X12_05000 [Bacteroidetes bacterium GWE2_29_8]|nr:MAG: hypothetical protein A2X12_05000 [Bacteroidetes bacterium GWE2_29_8]
MALGVVTTSIFSQDIITKKTGEDISAKVSEITQTEIKYKKFDNLEGPIVSILKSEVIMIRYENGTKDVFNETSAQSVVSSQTTVNNVTDEDMALKGREDAKANYRGAKSGAGWTAATTILFSPIIGVIPAVACSSAAPSDDNLNYRDNNLMKNTAYSKAYIDQAHKTKKKKVWTSFGIGSGAWVLLILLL